jgi:hypothetical protein
MSIRPSVIDRRGERPCIPDFYSVAKRMADGRAPTLADRIRQTLNALRSKLTR